MTFNCKKKGGATICPKCGRSAPDICPIAEEAAKFAADAELAAEAKIEAEAIAAAKGKGK